MKVQLKLDQNYGTDYAERVLHLIDHHRTNIVADGGVYLNWNNKDQDDFKRIEISNRDGYEKPPLIVLVKISDHLNDNHEIQSRTIDQLDIIDTGYYVPTADKALARAALVSDVLASFANYKGKKVEITNADYLKDPFTLDYKTISPKPVF
jgi:hypothetical protein